MPSLRQVIWGCIWCGAWPLPQVGVLAAQPHLWSLQCKFCILGVNVILIGPLVALFEWVKSPKWSGGQSGRPAGQPAGPLHDLGLTKVDQCTHCLLQLVPGGPTHNNLVVAEFSAAISAHGSLWLKKPSVVPLWSDAKDIADLLMISALGARQPRHPRC